MTALQQLGISGSCAPHEAQDGTLTLDCAATLTNPGPETLLVAVIGAVPGQAQLTIREYALPAGVSAPLPAPPAGGFWAIAYETQTEARRQRESRQFWGGLGQFALYFFAGFGAGNIGIRVYQGIKSHHQGY